jgi:hypothetical protein
VKLPVDNSIILSSTNDNLVIDRSDRPVPSLDDAQKLLPGWAREFDSPVRDAMLAAWRAMANVLWARIGHLLARYISPRFASGAWLGDWGAALKRAKSDETEGQYRTRLLNPPQVVTPNAIQAAVDAVVAEYTPIKAVYLEPAVDAAFCSPVSGCDWASFMQPSDTRLWADYPDNINPTVGAYLVPVVNTPLLWVVLPVPGDGDDLAFCVSLTATPVNPTDYISPDTAGYGFMFPPGDSLFERVRSEVDQRRMVGVPWFAFSDSILSNAR